MISLVLTSLNNKRDSNINPNNPSFQNILNASPGNIYWKGLNGVYLGCNRAMLQYVGLSSTEEVIGKTDFDLFEHPVAKKIREIDLSVIDTGTTITLKEETTDGSTFLSNKSPLRNKHGKVIGIIGNSINITQQEISNKKNEELEITKKRLQQRTQELAVALEAKERFLRNISHEMRTPLQSLLSIPELLKDKYDYFSEKQRKECIDLIVRSNDRLMSLMSNLLDLSDLRKGEFIMDLNEANVEYLVSSVINEFKYVHGQISLKIDDDVSRTITCDKFRISQVIRNIICNSIKYGGKDKPISIHVSNHNDAEKSYVKFSIKDRGIGISSEDKDRVFDTFVEGKKTECFSGGKGLGLSIAKEIVESHKGSIWVEDLNEDETGTQIIFII